MAESTTEGHKPPTHTRRSFFRKSAQVTGEMALGALATRGIIAASTDITPPPETRTKTEVNSPSELQRLKEAGLGDFINFYNQVDTLINIYKGSVVLPNALEFYLTCKLVAIGSLPVDHPDVIKIRDGWGEKRDATEEAVKDRIATFRIDTRGTTENPENIRKLLEPIGKFLPLNVLAMPDRIKVVQTDKQAYLNARDEEVGLKQMKSNNSYIFRGHENAVSALLHESNHALDYLWERIKPYTLRKDYIRYMESCIEHVTSMANAFFSTHPDIALQMQNGGPLIRTWNVDPDVLNEIEKYEKSFPGYSLSDIPQALQGDKTYRFNHLVHYIGNRLKELDAAKQWTEKDDPFLTNPAIPRLMNITFRELAHQFNDPVLSSNNDIVRSTKELAETGLIFTSHHLAFQQEKISLFSNQSRNFTLQEFREQLGLSSSEVDPSKENSVTYNSLIHHGTMLLKEVEISPQKMMRFYELPNSHTTPDKEMIYIEFSDKTRLVPTDCIMSVPKGYVQDVDNWKVESFLDGDEGIRYLLHLTGSSVDLHIKNEEYSSATKDVQVIPVTARANFPSIESDQIANADFVLTGDLKKKSPTNGVVLWREGRTGGIRLYLLPETYKTAPVSAFAIPIEAGADILLVEQPDDPKKHALLLDGTFFPAYPGMGGHKITQNEDGTFLLNDQKILLTEAHAKELKDLVEKYETGIRYFEPTVRISYPDDENTLPTTKYFLIMHYREFEGAPWVTKKFPIRPFV